MKAVIQRVKNASLTCGDFKSEIKKGLVVFFGVQEGDDESKTLVMAKKISKMRIFEDENGKTNLALSDVNGSLLLISQFTLYADCKKGNRPSFINAGVPDMANQLYEYIIEQCKEQIANVQTGSFGADMKISLVNDGPFTIVLDSKDL